MLWGGHQSSIINSEIALRATIRQQYRTGASPRPRVIGATMWHLINSGWMFSAENGRETPGDKHVPATLLFSTVVSTVLNIPSIADAISRKPSLVRQVRAAVLGRGAENSFLTRDRSQFREVADHSETRDLSSSGKDQFSSASDDDRVSSKPGSARKGRRRQAEKSSRARARPRRCVNTGGIENSRKLFSALA